jgi:hypothetical protein
MGIYIIAIGSGVYWDLKGVWELNFACLSCVCLCKLCLLVDVWENLLAWYKVSVCKVRNYCPFVEQSVILESKIIFVRFLSRSLLSDCGWPSLDGEQSEAI